MRRSVSESSFIPWMDQGLFLAHEAAGHHAVIQVVWRYGSGVDVDGLQRFVGHLEHGLLSRLVQPAVLPMGRHQWVRVVDRHVSGENLARRGGVATLLSSVFGDQLLLNVMAYEPRLVTNSQRLEQIVAEALVDVDLPEAVMYA